MKGRGRITCRRERGRRSCRTGVCMKECFKMVRKKVKVHLNGQTNRHTLGNGWLATLKAKDSISGQMAEYTQDNGKITNSTVKASILGPMVGNMLANTLMIKNKDLGPTPGQTAKPMKEIGLTANSTAKPSSPTPKAKAKSVPGKTENEPAGSSSKNPKESNQLLRTLHCYNTHLSQMK